MWFCSAATFPSHWQNNDGALQELEFRATATAQTLDPEAVPVLHAIACTTVVAMPPLALYKDFFPPRLRFLFLFLFYFSVPRLRFFTYFSIKYQSSTN